LVKWLMMSSHRPNTVVGTAGPVGASFAVAEKNWSCPTCKVENFARRGTCHRCRAKKPAGGGGQIWHKGMAQAAAGIDHNWREALDPSTKQIYYYNQKTGVTQWDRPEEMGQTPHATGWFGRGKAGGQSKLDELNEQYLKRPAPKQVDGPGSKNVAYHEGANEFNIWYGKYTGDQWKDNKTVEPAKSRCKVELHAGYTLADKKAGPDSRYFCARWIHGLCYKGSKCRYYHRIPTYADCGVLEKDMMHDCFGRDRHAKQRDDMQGVGSFNNNSRTLYVGRLQRTPYADKPKALNKALEKHFEEWGEVENINVIWGKSIAFVRYRFRSHAELAKEAMIGQTLDHDEILDIRWAFDDPNPVAKEAIRRANADAVVAAIKASGQSMENTKFAVPTSYDVPANAAAIEDKPGPKVDDELFYPNTDSQYDRPGKRQKR